MSLIKLVPDIQYLLDKFAAEHRVPGASLAIRQGGHQFSFATGLANARTRVEATTDTLFQIGSVTKVYTATIVLQLVDEGRLDLDDPVRKYVPEFTLKDTEAADAITVRQLLTHTAGVPGDHMGDFGSGDDAVERYVRSNAELDPGHDPGELFSYSNGGYILLGRLIENLTEQPYHRAFKERLIEPLGLTLTSVVPEDWLAHRIAAGHMIAPPSSKGSAGLPLPRGVPVVLDDFRIMRFAAPVGGLTGSTAGEVVSFARLHLDGGVAPSGQRLLSQEAIELMQQPYATSPGQTSGGPDSAIGFSWLVSDWGGRKVLGHGGGTTGQLSMLQVVPDRDLAIALLTNGPTGFALWGDLGGFLLDELADLTMPEPPTLPDEPVEVDLERYVGGYEGAMMRFDVVVKRGVLRLTMAPKGEMARMMAAAGGTQRVTLEPIDEVNFLGRSPAGQSLIAFVQPDEDGRPRYIHMGGRATRRVD